MTDLKTTIKIGSTPVGSDDYFSDHALICPRCGEANLHHHTVTAYNRAPDAVITRVTVITPDAVVSGPVPSSQCANPSSRRQGLTISFLCENCRCIAQLTLEQHKGTSYLRWRELGDDG